MPETAKNEVRAVLEKFQDGYDRRDKALIDDFRRLFVPDQELEVIGTGGIVPGDGEWCLGADAACDLVLSDWENWGDLQLDMPNAHIHLLGDVAWLSVTGTVKMDLEPEEAYQNYLKYIDEVAKDGERSPRARLLEILRGGTNTVFEAERGKLYVWPLRFTAVLIRRGGRWLFHQIQFSFATTRFPDVRNM